MRKALLILLGILGCGILLPHCKSNRFVAKGDQILMLDKAVYPLDTVALEGYLNFGTMDQWLIVFTKNLEPGLGERDALKLLKTKKAAVYYDPYTFDGLISHRKDISPDKAVELEERVKEQDPVVNGDQVRFVKGDFVVGITLSSHISGLISHSYEFKDDFEVLVVTPVMNEE